MSYATDVMSLDPTRAPDRLINLIRKDVNYDLIKKNAYDKFGDGDYISVETTTDLLNEIFGFVWSWEIVHFYDKGDYVVCHSRICVPGIGVREGIGQAKADKKDNSTMYSAAASFSLKNAAKRFGIAPNLFNKDGIGFGVFEPEQEVAATAVAHQEVKSIKVIPDTAKAKGAELKELYGIKTKEEFVRFAQTWNPAITSYDMITAQVIEDLHKYVEENSEEFEDFLTK